MRTRAYMHRGFTLIETVVAISILMLGVLGPMHLARQNIKASRDAGDRLVASFLAQEGIEAVRNVIANNSADTSTYANWLNGVTDPGPGSARCDLPSRCVIDITQSGPSILQRCNGLCTPVIYQDTNTFIYRQSSSGNPGAPWAATKFQRLVSVQAYGGDSKRIMASTTIWWPRGNITLQEDIYNWFFQIN